MFDHPFFNVCRFAEIPLDCDSFLVEDTYMAVCEKVRLRWFAGHQDPPEGYVSYVAARKVTAESLELSWYPNVSTRFHEMTISLPRGQFLTCIDVRRYDDHPHIFVKAAWLRALLARTFSAYALVDAVGVKHALQAQTLSRDRLLTLRHQIDDIADRHPGAAFVSFADSLLIKAQWTVGHFQGDVPYTYDPEGMIRILDELRAVYARTVGLEIYSVLTQGANEYFDDPPLHVSARGNHVSLNSLGIPFAELLAIDDAARAAIKSGAHDQAQLYMDKTFLHSLNLDFGFDRDALIKGHYRARMMSADGLYYGASLDHILQSLRNTEPTGGICGSKS